MTDETPPTPPTPVADAHASRFRVEMAVAIISAILTGLGALSGLNPTAQAIVATAAAVVGVYAGIAFIRARGAKKRGR